MSSWHSPGDAVLAAPGGCACVPVSVSSASVSRHGRPCVPAPRSQRCEIWDPSPGHLCCPDPPRPWPGRQSKVAESLPCQRCSAQINKLSWRPEAELCLVTPQANTVSKCESWTEKTSREICSELCEASSICFSDSWSTFGIKVILLWLHRSTVLVM